MVDDEVEATRPVTGPSSMDQFFSWELGAVTSCFLKTETGNQFFFG